MIQSVAYFAVTDAAAGASNASWLEHKRRLDVRSSVPKHGVGNPLINDLFWGQHGFCAVRRRLGRERHVDGMVRVGANLSDYVVIQPRRQPVGEETGRIISVCVAA